MEQPTREAQKAKKLRLGWRVFAALVTLTALEFYIASLPLGPVPYPVLCGLLAPITWFSISAAAHPLPYLAVIAVIKVALILVYFMHIAQVWRREGGHR